MPSSVLFMFMSVQVAVLQWVRASTSNCSQQTDTLLPIYFSFLCTYFSNSRGLSFLMWEIGEISSSLKCFSNSRQNNLFKVHDAWQYGDSDFFFFFFLLIRHYQKHHILTRCLLILLLVKGIWCFIIRLLQHSCSINIPCHHEGHFHGQQQLSIRGSCIPFWAEWSCILFTQLRIHEISQGSYSCMLLLLSHFSCVRLCATP